MSGLRNSSVSPATKRRLISEAVQAAKAQRRKAEASPQRSDFEREFGRHNVKDEPDGSWSCTVRESADVRKAYEMQAGVRQIDVEQGAAEQAKLPREKVVRKADGRVIDYPEELIEQTKHKFRPAGRNGKAPALYFGPLGESRWVKGTGTLWFFWDGGWEPRPAEGSPHSSPQVDPDGNVWVEASGEWLLESEV